MLIRMQIEHELRERALQPRQPALVDDETRAGNFRRRFEIHQPEAFADFEMLLRREVEFARLAPARDFDIVVLVGAVRNFIERRIGNARERIVEFGDRIALGLFERRPVFLDPRDFRL